MQAPTMPASPAAPGSPTDPTAAARPAPAGQDPVKQDIKTIKGIIDKLKGARGNKVRKALKDIETVPPPAAGPVPGSIILPVGKSAKARREADEANAANAAAARRAREANDDRQQTIENNQDKLNSLIDTLNEINAGSKGTEGGRESPLQLMSKVEQRLAITSGTQTRYDSSDSTGIKLTYPYRNDALQRAMRDANIPPENLRNILIHIKWAR